MLQVNSYRDLVKMQSVFTVLVRLFCMALFGNGGNWRSYFLVYFEVFH